LETEIWNPPLSWGMNEILYLNREFHFTVSKANQCNHNGGFHTPVSKNATSAWGWMKHYASMESFISLFPKLTSIIKC
jgi:hypothetical protein